ncbi:MAG: hypothetical protein EA424_08470 [Planctomycetaceae bacterium]|nr:MAG: hypothetical protein EA424_08470 [Planctomycetaceae bacterium]
MRIQNTKIDYVSTGQFGHCSDRASSRTDGLSKHASGDTLPESRVCELHLEDAEDLLLVRGV